MRVIIKKLFNKYNYDLSFDNKLNVIIGENGCGKTTAIKMINNLINQNFIELSNYSFESFEIQDEVSVVIRKNDLEQLAFTKNYDFRPFIFNLNYDKFSSFDQFIKEIHNKSEKFYKYPSNTNCKDDYINNVDKYLEDDKEYINNDSFIDYMKQFRIPYGSLLYLKYLYSFFKKEVAMPNLNNISDNAKFYSFIDINDLNCNIIDFDEKKISLLSNYFDDKHFIKNGNHMDIIDNNTNCQIEFSKLSSGEKKIIKFINVILNCNERTILLLDEPELSLSIYWQRKLIEDLMNNCIAKRIMITTQSTSLLMEDEIDLLVPLFADFKEGFNE